MIEPIPHFARLSAVLPRYDAIICDVWGVLHNGVVATPGAAEALAAARNAGVAVVLLTNAPRPPAEILQQLRGFGIADASHDRIVSSGGVTRTLIAEQGPSAFYHIGPPRDVPIYEGLEALPGALEAARFVLCTGLVDDETETAADYRPILEAARARDLPLYCANPDLVVERGTQLLPCAGAIGDLYEQLGGRTIYVGKPYPLVYQRAHAAIAEMLGREAAPGRILCIGDALRTDVAGARAAGHDCLMTLAGIHAHEIGLDGARYDREKLEALARRSGARPTMTMVSLGW